MGRRQGAPLILGEPLHWNGVAVTLEAQEPAAGEQGELTLRLPPWSEFQARLEEDSLWDLVDRLAEEFRAVLGVVSDGRAVGYPDLERPERTVPRLQRLHLGLILPRAWLPHLRPGSTPYRTLGRSRLCLVLE